MKAPYLTNILLAIIIVTAYFLLNTNEETHTDIQTLSPLIASDISSIVVTRQDRKAITLQKHDKEWSIESPIKAKANTTRVNLILNLLSSRSYSQFSPNTDNSLQQFELDPAMITLQLNQQVFGFGAIESLSKRRYVMYNNSIHLVDDTLAPLLNSTVESFIDNRLLGSGFPIKQIKLPQSLSPTDDMPFIISLEQGHWQSNDSTVSNETLSAIVQAWQNAYAMQLSPITREDIKHLTGDKIIVSAKHEDKPITFIAESTQTSLFLTNINTQLKYQFPIALKKHLFPSKESD